MGAVCILIQYNSFVVSEVLIPLVHNISSWISYAIQYVVHVSRKHVLVIILLCSVQTRDSAVRLCIVPIVYTCSIILACRMYQDYNQCMLAGLQETKVILHVHYPSSLLLGIRDP